MYIRELARRTGISATTIRYYEGIGLLPPPRRGPNNYRQYTPADTERLRFIASARNLGFSLAELAEILAARDAGVAPCDRVLDILATRLSDLDRRIAELLVVRDALEHLRRDGAGLAQGVRGEQCVCTLLTTYSVPESPAVPDEEVAYG
jgi:DNA-binding transcriptional MerR regulator